MRCISIAAILAVFLSGCVVRLLAQDDDYNEDSKLNTHMGIMVTAPLKPTSQFLNVGGGFTAGAGYNFSNHHALIGDFMWNRLGASDAALAPIRDAVGTNDVHGHGSLFALTANYRFELRGKTTGVYFIAGGGWYHRKATVSTHVATGSSISCTRTWEDWGFNCSSGIVTSDQTLASSISDVLGANGGVGVTFRVGESPRYRVFLEARYHYAPTKNVKTELIPITFGIRF